MKFEYNSIVGFSLATYNLLDLFEVDEAYVSGKVTALSPIVRALNADVIGFQEVASDAALARILEASGLGGATVVHGTRDARGIGSSLVSRLPVLEREILVTDELPFPVFFSNDAPPFGRRLPLRRGFVSALVDAGDFGRVRVLVAHLKSGRGVPLKDPDGAPLDASTQAEWGECDLRALIWRSAEAIFLRRAVDAAFARGDAQHIAVVGDMNDVSGSFPLRLICGRGEHGLSEVAQTIARDERFSTLHRGNAEVIDHMLVSNEMFARLDSARFDNEGLLDLSTLPLDAPRPHGSDHAPLVAHFGVSADHTTPAGADRVRDAQ